ncbi:MAG: sigma-70 family RNA polymerase sigma factor [Longicatena sp.]
MTNIRVSKEGDILLCSDIEKLLEMFGVDIYRFCLKLCQNKVDAEDLYQQTFLKMMEIETKLDWNDYPKAFVFSITNSIWKNGIRKNARHQRIAGEISIVETNEHLVVDKSNLAQNVQDSIRNQVLHELIQELEDKYRIPVLLFYAQDCSVYEIAQIINKPEGTIKSRLFKARNILKKRLEEKGYEN